MGRPRTTAVACALLYSGYPAHVRPQSYLLPTPNVHCLRTLPMPTRAGTKPNRNPPRLRGPPRPSSSFRLMRDRTPSLMASLWASSSSSSSRTHHHHACHAILASLYVPTSRRAHRRPPYHASNTLQRTPARLVIWSFGHLVVFQSGCGTPSHLPLYSQADPIERGREGEGGCDR